jgi:hypothetical protein
VIALLADRLAGSWYYRRRFCGIKPGFLSDLVGVCVAGWFSLISRPDSDRTGPVIEESFKVVGTSCSSAVT